LCKVKYSTADPGIASSPLIPTKMTKKEICTGSSPENAPVYQCLTLGTFKNLVCHVRYLALGPLIETNNRYAPTPNRQSVAKQKQYPPQSCKVVMSFKQIMVCKWTVIHTIVLFSQIRRHYAFAELTIGTREFIIWKSSPIYLSTNNDYVLGMITKRLHEHVSYY